MTRRGALWSSVGLCAFVAVCCWLLVAAVLDGRHFQPYIAGLTVSSGNQSTFVPNATPVGHPTWIYTSVFAGRTLPVLLLLAGALSAWMHHRLAIAHWGIRIAVAGLALCSAAVAVIGLGAMFDRHMPAAVAYLGRYPDSMRATAGEEIVCGIAVLVLADLTYRSMRLTLAPGQQVFPIGRMGGAATKHPIAGLVAITVLAAGTGIGVWSLSRPQKGMSQTRVAETNLRNALTAEQTAWTNNQQFSPASELGSVDPNLPFAPYPEAPTAMATGTVYVQMLDGADVELSAVAGKRLYTVVQSNNATDPATHYGVTALSAGRPDPTEITALAW